MTFTFRPAVRSSLPVIIGLSGPSKSGKSLSALRLAKGLAGEGKIAMINTEGARGHLYAASFQYEALDLTPPYAPERYTEAVEAAGAVKPAVLIIDSMSHMHDGPGGMLEYHEAEIDRILGNRKNDQAARQKNNFSGWIRPKHAENQFVYACLNLDCHIIWCFRAKEKLLIRPGREPENLGWQPIAGDRVSFETLFTLCLPPHSGGVPNLAMSDLRDPFGTMIPDNRPLDEALGRKLAEWARGGSASGSGQPGETRAEPGPRNPDRAPADTPAWQAAEAPAEPPESGMRNEAPGAFGWTTADLKPRLTAAALSMNDLRLALKVPAVTKDNFEQLINQYLDGAPNRTLDTLIADTQAAISAATDAPGLPLEAAPA